jgi:hypothetical protein
MFKKGYYYKFIGNKNNYYWSKDDEKILNKKWNKCIGTDGNYYIKFEGMKHKYYWEYEDFIESKYSPEWKIKRLLEEIR